MTVQCVHSSIFRCMQKCVFLPQRCQVLVLRYMDQCFKWLSGSDVTCGGWMCSSGFTTPVALPLSCYSLVVLLPVECYHVGLV